jgi:hypothetical protein
MNFIRRFLARLVSVEYARIESRRAGLADANIRYTLKIKEQEQQISELYKALDYHKILNAHYAADRQSMMAEHGPDYAVRKFPRVTKFLNEKEGKGK